MTLSKKDILQRIIDQLLAEAELYTRAARAAHAEATDEQSRAENKYDTRGLEASYLARGQSRQAAEIELALTEFRALSIRDWNPDSAIEVGALVELVNGREHTWYFLGPRAGGLEISHQGSEITVLTPQSPLGKQLLGRKMGDRLLLELGGRQLQHRITTVR